MNISELMTPDIKVVDPNTTTRDAAMRIGDGDVGALPVGEDDRLVGMVTDRDIVPRGVAANLAPDDCTARKVMSEGAYYCFDDEDAQRAADIMAEHEVRRLPVLNRDKRFVGIVAVADLARAGITEHPVKEASEPTQQERL